MRSGYAALASVMVLGLALGACETDSPTAPQQTVPPPSTPGPSATWNVTVTTDPSTVTLGEEGSVTFTVLVTATVRRAGTNQPPPNGSTAIVSTPLSAGTLTLNNGVGSATLTITATAAGAFIVQVSFEGSVGQSAIDVEEFQEEVVIPLFIERVQPDRGGPNGGQRVRISGSGFEEPTRVLFGTSPAVVQSVAPTLIVVQTPIVDLDVGEILTVPVTVSVNVNEEGTASDTLDGAFTFTRGGGGGGGGGGGRGGRTNISLR
jgi:hypothetical protein